MLSDAAKRWIEDYHKSMLNEAAKRWEDYHDRYQ